MKTRRDFVKCVVTGVAGAATWRSVPAAEAAAPARPVAGIADRAAWVELARRLASPVLGAAAARRLKTVMPIEAAPGVQDRAQCTHLEALGRVLCGLAPWLELGDGEGEEGRLRSVLVQQAREAIDAATDPHSPDFLNFFQGQQPLVDAAFLAQALRRAPVELWRKLPARVQANVIAALRASRVIVPGDNNWRLFATTVEVFLQEAGEVRDAARLFEGLAKHQAWYVGDGVYGDGPHFHWDYYNSFVIQPMVVEALDRVGDEAPEWRTMREQARLRLARWAAIQERMIAPDGTYPVVGRSMAYRCGAFQGLALAALRRGLPDGVVPAQARVALTAVIQRTLGAPGTFAAEGWLQIGLSGHQPDLGERYISTGSLYLCSAAFLPLGLPVRDAFWSDPPVATSWQRAWAGGAMRADHALAEPTGR